MPVLTNPKHERFAQLVAAGENKTEAAKSLGYSASRAASTGCNLAKNSNIAARIAELSASASAQSMISVSVDRTWVLVNLKTVAERCMASDDFQPSGANRALELLGKELGMFRDQSDHTFKWDGDITKLDANQQAKLMQALETIAFKGDAEAKARAEAEVLREIDAPAAGAVQ